MGPPSGHNTLASCPRGTQGQWLSLAPSPTTPLPAPFSSNLAPQPHFATKGDVGNAILDTKARLFIISFLSMQQKNRCQLTAVA